MVLILNVQLIGLKWHRSSKMHGEFYIDNVDGVKINPATEEKQSLLLNEVVQSVSRNSLDFGTEKITLGAVAITAGDQPCRTCLVSHSNSNATYMGNSADGAASANSFLLPADIVVEVPVRNTNKLSFFGTAADTVTILWRD